MKQKNVLKGYTEDTRDKVITFLKKKGSAYTNEILRLGGKKKRIDGNSLKKIISDLEVEEKVVKKEFGNGSIIVYTWIGGNSV